MGSIIFSFRNFRKAFTLIELMIVISIIGVLAAALYPQVGKYMSRGRDAGRITAITNINTALDLTRFDNNGNYLPHSGGCVPMANLVNRKYLMIPIQSPSGTGYNEGCGNNGQYAYGNMGIGYILMSTMENLFTGNYSGSTVGFTGTITRSGALNALNTKKGMGRYYIYPTNSILNSALTMSTSTGQCSTTVANSCLVGTVQNIVAGVCGGANDTWGCQGGTGAIASCTLAHSCSTAGVCGTANGADFLSYPTGGHCTDIAMPVTNSDVNGNDGNFNWTCGGIGGGAVACSAKIQYTISGTFGNNGSGATVSNVGGKSTIADKTGYFSIKVDHETSAIGVKASRLGYTCKTTQAGSNKITANDTNIRGYCVLNNYTISGGWTNGAGAKVNVCGKNITADSSGNFSLAISGATNCSSATASKSHYTFNNLSGPNYLASDYKFGIGTGTPDTQTGNCGTLPSNSTASTASIYTQTWNGIGWSPITKWTKGGSICGFTCNKNYTWNNIDSCIADTRTYTCAAKPATTIWNTVDSYNQTWNGTMWNPIDSTSTYDKISSKTSCRYACASGYKWNSLSCELIMNGTCGSASGTIVSAYPTANLCNSGKLADIDMTGTDGVYNWDCNGSGGGTNISCSATKILCAPVETLINGYYVIDPTQPNCSLGCNVAGLTDPTNKCILKLGTTYIAPGATDVNKINTPCGGSASPCSVAIKSDTTNVIGYCSGATWGGKTWFFPTYPTNTKNNLSLLLNTQTNYWTRHCENCDKYTGIKWRINSSGGSTAGNTASYAVRCESNSTAAVNGSCGTSNGGISASTPSTNLCTSGTSSSVSGTGPWTWNCSGSNGGTTEACNVNLGYTVTFDGNGGTGHTPTSKVVAYNAAVGTLPSTPPNRTGYTFNGWFTAKTGGTAVTAATVISGNVTFYAQWIINGACGSANGVATASYPTGNWCTTGIKTDVNTTGSGGTYNWSCNGSGGGTNISCSATVKHTVTFDGNGGVGHTPTIKSVTYNTAVGTLPSNPTRSGYTLNGWFTTMTGGTAVSTTTVITGNVTFYAQWKLGTNGICGAMNNAISVAMPTKDLCIAGNPSSISGTEEQWKWKCPGTGAGSPVQCATKNITCINKTPITVFTMNGNIDHNLRNEFKIVTDSGNSYAGVGYNTSCIGYGRGRRCGLNSLQEKVSNIGGYYKETFEDMHGDLPLNIKYTPIKTTDANSINIKKGTVSFVYLGGNVPYAYIIQEPSEDNNWITKLSFFTPASGEQWISGRIDVTPKLCY